MRFKLIKPDLNKPVFTLFPKMKQNIEAGLCPICESPIVEEEFTDELSAQEYSVSGMCQRCQNEMFKDEVI